MINLEKYEDLKIIVLNKIQNANKEKPITSKTLCNELNISFRLLKELITSLRADYPIVSKETNGGGYWIATTESEILSFINMINARKRGYEETIQKMNIHLKEL